MNAPYPLKSIIFTSCGSESDNRAIDIAVHHYHTAKERVGDTVRTDKVKFLYFLRNFLVFLQDVVDILTTLFFTNRQFTE